MNKLLAVAAASFALMGCSDDAYFCTLIGCGSGLTVQVTNPPAGPYRIEAYVTGSSSRFGHNCPGGPCTASFPDFTPADLFVDIITASDTTTREVQPTYVVSRPNGPRCEPECRSATVTVAP